MWEQSRCFLVTFCHRTKSYPLAAGQRKPLPSNTQKIKGKELDSGFRLNDEQQQKLTS